MAFESLVHKLTADLEPVRRRHFRVDLAIIVSICAVEILVFFASGAARSDRSAMLEQPTFWWRVASLGLIAAISGLLAVLSFSPTYCLRRSLRWVLVVVGACLAAGLFMRSGPVGTASIVRRIDWTDGIRCAGKIIALSIPPVVGLGALMRRGAPTDRNGTAVLAGLAAAAWGAFVFVFACPFNDPLYIAVWYGVGCGVVILAARLSLPRLARW